MILSKYKVSGSKLIKLFIVLLLAFFVSGCAQSSPALGTFVCSSAELGEFSIQPELIYGKEVVLELGENGQGKFILGDDSGLVKWTLDGTQLSIVFDKQTYLASYVNESFQFELPDRKLLLTFVKDDAIFRKEGKSQVLSYYGWWDIGDANEQWQNYSGMWFDCCAVIELADSGEAELILWDEDSSYVDPISRVKLILDENGTITAVKGAFIDCEIDGSNLRFNTKNLQFENLIIAELAYSDDRGVFNSVIYLRPWGELWDDIKEEAPELMPYHYDNWYLPLVEAKSQMPGEFEIN